ncbi:MAG: hypothetical protein GF372_12380 [Candidatus Marinimicrobia bacterium]|nr:hypothetical protein [Candidatus Neomarinimicrobiota bacterium]
MTNISDVNSNYVFIIGAMKAGTTSLFDSLANHPQICPSKVKEPEYFSSNERHRAKLDNYESLWNFNPVEHKYKLEGSTGYTKYPFEKNVPENIASYGISPRFIYLVRDPVERIESQYNFLNLKSDDAPQSFTDPYYINLSKYNMQLQQYLKIFPDTRNFLILDFEEMKLNNTDFLSKISSFLEIQPFDISSSNVAKNKTPLNKFDLWIRKVAFLKNTVGGVLPDDFRRKLKSTLGRYTPSLKTSIDDKTRERIRTLLKSDMILFQKEFGFQINKWGFDK